MQRRFGVFRPMILKYSPKPFPNLVWFLLHKKKLEPIPTKSKIFMTADNKILMTSDGKILMVR